MNMFKGRTFESAAGNDVLKRLEGDEIRVVG